MFVIILCVFVWVYIYISMYGMCMRAGRAGRAGVAVFTELCEVKGFAKISQTYLHTRLTPARCEEGKIIEAFLIEAI